MRSRDVELMRDYLILSRSYAEKTADIAETKIHEGREYYGTLIKEQRRRIRELDRLIAVTGDEIDALRATEQDAVTSTTTKKKASKTVRKRSTSASKKTKSGGKVRNAGRSL